VLTTLTLGRHTREGFVVNGGALRLMEDPANAAFLDAIANGQYPPELRPTDPHSPVHVNLVRKDEPYVAPPEPKYTAFTGAGRTLGGGAAGGSGAGAAAAGAAAVLPPAAAGATPGVWVVDETAPVTSLQLRLLDGSRVVARFNNSMTVAHIRAFIDSWRPGTGSIGILQVGGMPPRTLTDPSATLEAAGLLSAVVIQKQ
jgi:UBX domain-containing protein 1